MADKTAVNMSKTQVCFSFEGEIAKIKITIPLIELITQDMYRSQFLKFLNIGNNTNTLNFTNNNTPVYSIHSDLDSFILYNKDDISEQVNKIEIDSDIPQ